MKTLPDWTDQRFEELIANLLRTGVLLSATVVLLGAILYLARHGFSPADYRVFRGEPRELKSVQGIIGYALQRHGRGLINKLGCPANRDPGSACHIFSVWICQGTRLDVRWVYPDRAGGATLQPVWVVLDCIVSAAGFTKFYATLPTLYA